MQDSDFCRSTVYKHHGHGGYIHNSNGDMIVAYTDNITAEYPLEVELQGLLKGLTFVWTGEFEKSFRKMTIWFW